MEWKKFARRLWNLVDVGSNIQFLLLVGGSTVLTAVATAFLRLLKLFPAPLLVVFALGLFMVFVASARILLGKFQILPSVDFGDSQAKVRRIPEPRTEVSAETGWHPPVSPERLAEYLDQINRTMEAKGFGSNPNLPGRGPTEESKRVFLDDISLAERCTKVANDIRTFVRDRKLSRPRLDTPGHPVEIQLGLPQIISQFDNATEMRYEETFAGAVQDLARDLRERLGYDIPDLDALDAGRPTNLEGMKTTADQLDRMAARLLGKEPSD